MSIKEFGEAYKKLMPQEFKKAIKQGIEEKYKMRNVLETLRNDIEICLENGHISIGISQELLDDLNELLGKNN